MTDQQSKDLLARILLYRLTCNFELNCDVATKFKHYFGEDVYKLSDKEIFTDCGGYNGDTLREFKKLTNGKYKGYYLFEPDVEPYDKAKQYSDDMIHLFNCGVWNSKTSLKFAVETANGNGSIIGTTDNRQKSVIEIPVVNIDSIVSQAAILKRWTSKVLNMKH